MGASAYPNLIGAPGLSVLQDPSASGLRGLVARTTGLQPWRKVVHACNAIVFATALTILDWSHVTLVLALGAIVAILLTIDLVRLTRVRANEAFFRAFAKLASPREAKGIASSTWYAAGVLAAVALFPRREAIAGILVLGLADPAAAYVGVRFGGRPLLGGTVAGSVAFFATSVLVLSFQFGWPAAVGAALTATIAERRSWPLDDNLTIPVVCAGTLLVMGWIS